MPVAVGVIVAVIFLIAFSGWFYNLISGWNDFVLDDVYFKYRIVGASLLSIVVVTATFFGMAYAFECPNEERSGVFSSLNCPDYRNIKTGVENLFKQRSINVEATEGETAVDEGKFIFGR